MDAFESLPENIKEKITKVDPEGVDLYQLELDTNINKRAIPSKDSPEVIESFNKNRSVQRYSGAVQLGKQKERVELKQLLSDQSVRDYLNAKNRGVVTLDTISVIDYIPNSRFAYYNKLIKAGLQSGLSLCDVDVARNVWMNKENVERLVTLLGTMVDENKNSFTYMPSTKSGVKFVCREGKSKPLFRNPGTVDMPYHLEGYRASRNDSCGCSNDKIAHDIVSINDHISSIIAKYEAEYMYNDDDKIINEYFGPEVAKLLHWSREMALSGKVDLHKLLQLTKAFHNTQKILNTSYVMSLIDPFKYCQEVRIPSQFPIPTASFSVSRNISLITNDSGNVAFAINPFYLATSNTSCAINNDATLTGVNSSDFFKGVDLGQAMPVPFYSRYRLVSAAVRVIFTASSLNSTGFATMTVDFDQAGIGAIGAIISQYAKYASFSQIENGFFKQTKAVNNGNSMQINYLPVDTSMQEFFQIGGFSNGFVFNGYISGAPKATTVARLDTVFNYEAFVHNQYTDYVPSAANDNSGEIDECKMFINQCSVRKYATPDDMQKVIPPKYYSQPTEAPIVPTQPVQVITPVDKTTITDTIKEIGKDILTTIVEDKLKDKPTSEKFDVVDKIKTKLPSNIAIDYFDRPSNKYAPAIGGAAAGAGILGTILGIGSKLLPFL